MKNMEANFEFECTVLVDMNDIFKLFVEIEASDIVLETLKEWKGGFVCQRNLNRA